MSQSVVYLLEAQPYDPVAATTKHVYFSSGLLDDAELGQTDPYPVRLMQAFSHETSVFDQNIPGSTQISIGTTTINNVDGRFDYLLDYAWDGRVVVIKKGYRGQAYISYTTEFVGTALEIIADRGLLVLSLRDNSYKIAKAHQPMKYTGGGGKEGILDLRNQQKPLTYGSVRNAAPIQVDPVYLTFQLHDGAISSVTKVYDRGVPLTFAANYVSYSDMVTFAVPAGMYSTCLNEGFIRLGAKLAGTLTVDLAGQYSDAATLPDLIKAILKGRGGLVDSDLNLPSFVTMAADCPWSYEGVYLQTPDSQTDELLETLVSAVNGFWYVNPAGLLTIRAFKFASAVANIRLEDVDSLQKTNSPPPLYRVKTNYAKNPTVQTTDDFTIPRATLNGYLKDYRIFVPTAADGTGGVYSYVGEFNAFLNTTKVNDLDTVQFMNRDSVSWLTVLPDGTFTITDPGANVTSAVIRASLGEFIMDETFTVVRDVNVPLHKNLTMSATAYYFYWDSSNTPSPGGQSITVTAVLNNLTLPLSWSAIDNLGNVLTMTGTGNSRTLPIANVILSPLTAYVTITASAIDGTQYTDSVKIMIVQGDDGYSAGVLGALAAADSSVDIFYQNTPPTGAKTNDMWFDLDDNNKLYMWNGASWVLIADARVAVALTNAAGAQATADGKVTSFFGEGTPVAGAVGDLWYKPSTRTMYRWDGAVWTNQVGTVGAQSGVNLQDSTGASLGDVDVNNQYAVSQSQTASSLFMNPTFDVALSSGRPAGVTSGLNGGVLDNTLVGWDGGVVGGNLAIGTTTASSVRCFFPMFRSDVKSTYKVRLVMKKLTATAGTLYVRFMEYDSEPTFYALYMAANVTPDSTGVTATREISTGGTGLTGGTSVEAGDLTTSFQTVTILYQPTSTAKFTGLEIIRSSGPGLVVQSCTIDRIAPITLAQLDSAAQATLDAGLNSDGTVKATRVSLASLATGLTAVEILGTLPVVGNFTGRTVLLTTDQKMYRYNGSSFVATVPTTDLTGQIVYGQLAANSVTATNIVIADYQNLIGGGTFASGTLDGWTRITNAGGSGGSQTVADGNAFTTWPSRYALYQVRGTSNNTAEISISPGNYDLSASSMQGGIPCELNDSFYFQCVNWTSGSAIPKIEAFIRTTPSVITSLGLVTLSTGTFVLNSSIITNSVGRGNLYLKLYNASSGTNSAGAEVYWWNVVLMKRNNGNLIVDGSITTSKLVANVITSNELATSSVTAAKINVASLSAISATIGTLRTATSGARTEIVDNLITVYDTSNVLRVRMGIW